MNVRRKNVKRVPNNFSFPSTKLRNVFCVKCKHQFFLQEFVPLRGIVPLLLECGHVICDKCGNSFNEPCPICKMVSQCKKGQTFEYPLNMYILGLMVMSHNRPVNTDDLDISFCNPVNSKSKQQSTKGLCHECGIQAAIQCPQCIALFCRICYSKIHGRALQNHTKIVLSEVDNEHSFGIKNTCSERCDEALGYYCVNCNIAGCSHCMLRLHKTHQYQPLIKKNEELLVKFLKVLDQVSENLQRVQQAQKKLKGTSLCPVKTQNIDSVETNVTQHFAHLHGVLQNTERKIIDSLRQHRSARDKNIDEISLQLKDHENRLQSALIVTKSITENLDKVDLQHVMQKLKILVDIPCYLVLNSVVDQREIKFDIDTSITEVLEKHCNLQIPETSNYSLERKGSLPDDYNIEPLVTEINASKHTDKPMILKQKPTSSNPPENNDNPPTIGSSEMVRITHIVDPSFFFVQLVQKRQKIEELNRELNEVVNTVGMIPTEVIINALYIVQCAQNRVWYRARVLTKEINTYGDDRYSVMFIDYGTIDTNVSLQRIRNIIPQFAMLPVMALKCTLFDVVPTNGKWHPDAINAFEKLVCTNSVVSMSIMMITGDTYYVDLCVISSKDSGLISVKDSLTYTKYATCVSPNKLLRMNPDSTRTYFKEQLELNTFTDVEVLFVESPNSIYVQKAHANRTYFCKLTREMTEEYERNTVCIEQIPVPFEGLPCAARGADGLWYRGLISEVTENTVKFFYVDLGYTLMLGYDAIRTLHKKYMSCKTQAIKVSLKHVRSQNEWSAGAIEFTKKFLIHTKNFQVVAFNKFEDTYNVAMYTHDKIDVARTLIKNDLALPVVSSYHNTNATNKFKNKKNKFRKNVNNLELPAYELYDDPVNVSKNKSLEETNDPFKICVQIHHMQSPDCIYVSDVSCDQTDIEQMMVQLQDFYNKYRSAKRDVWNKDAVCAVYSSKTDMYYRGRIVDIKPDNKVVVFLYDIGIEETVPITDIQSLYPLFSKISTYVFKIKLTGILPCGGSATWPSFSCEKLHEIISNNQNSKFYISKLEEEDVEDCAIPVELWIKQVKMDGPLAPTRHEINSVNRMLVENGVALPVKEYAKKRDKILAIELKRQLLQKLERLTKYESNVKWFEINKEINNCIEIDIIKETWKTSLQHSSSESDSKDYSIEEVFDTTPSLPKLSMWLPAKPIKEDKFIAIPTYLDHDGFVYLHSKTQNGRTLRYIETKLENLYNSCPIESCDTVWTAGDLCIAQYHANNKWYRGKILKVQGNDIINVEFVDYGNIEECTVGTVKKKVVLEDIPIQCTKCFIYGLNPGNENEMWITEDLDKIHSLIIEKECEVTIINRTETYLVISLTILPNKHCNEKSDLIKFLINKWKMNIKPISEDTISENNFITNTLDETIENSKFCADNEIIKHPIIIENSSLIPRSDIDKSESSTATDVENLSWNKIEDEIVTSTPCIASEENLSMNYKVVNIPKDIDYIEIELCCSISLTEFCAQMKENTHSMVLNTYYMQYESLMNDLQENAYKQPMVTVLAPNTPCCAKFNDDLWYRGLIIESEPIIDSDNIEIKLLYVDYGNEEYRKVNSQQCELYTLKQEWIDVPTMAIKCKLWNIKVASTEDYSKLLPQLERMYNKRVIATVKEIDEEFMNVELYEDEKRKELMYSKLIEEGLFELKSEQN